MAFEPDEEVLAVPDRHHDLKARRQRGACSLRCGESHRVRKPGLMSGW